MLDDYVFTTNPVTENSAKETRFHRVLNAMETVIRDILEPVSRTELKRLTEEEMGEKIGPRYIKKSINYFLNDVGIIMRFVDLNDTRQSLYKQTYR